MANHNLAVQYMNLASIKVSVTQGRQFTSYDTTLALTWARDASNDQVISAIQRLDAETDAAFAKLVQEAECEVDQVVAWRKMNTVDTFRPTRERVMGR